MRKAIAVTILAISFCYCFGQSTNSKPLEPTVIGDVFLLDSSTQTLKPLPSEPWQETSTHMGALSGGYMHSVQLPGNRADYQRAGERELSRRNWTSSGSQPAHRIAQKPGRRLFSKDGQSAGLSRGKA
jgi:hypothetical protein